MKKYVGLKTLKTGVGATMSMLIASIIGLKYMTAAGIITMLSIQTTRRESVVIALRRLGATCIALTLGALVFSLFGFHALSFGIYVMFFIPIAVRLKVSEGIVPASVLVTHLLGEGTISGSLLLNELLLMIVGAGVALIVNIYMPSIQEELLIEKHKIEDMMQQIFFKMEQTLQRPTHELDVEGEFSQLRVALERAKTKASQSRNNTFFSQESLYEKYFDMRYSQYQILIYMKRHFENFYELAPQAYKMAGLTHQVGLSTKGLCSVEEVMTDLEMLREEFKVSTLPSSREEFENRAMLYQFLTDMEQLLFVKQLFKDKLSDREKEEYSRYYKIDVFPGK